MQLKPLKVFCDVVGRRSFSRAADENGISQSGASQVVHQLETGLGVKLIDRSKRPFVLTQEGETYYAGCRKLVNRYLALEEEVRTMHQEVSGRVRVAAIYSVGLHHMDCCLKQFLGQHPKADVRLEYQHPSRVREMVEQDQADLGLVSYPKSSRTIKAVDWREDPMVLVCAPSSRFAKLSETSLQQLNGADMVGFDHDLGIRREIDRVLHQHRVDANVVLEFDNIETIKRAIEIDTGVGLLPRTTVKRETESGTLVAVSLAADEFARPLGIIYRRNKEFGATARRFMELLRSEGNATTTGTAESVAASNGHSDNGHDSNGHGGNGNNGNGHGKNT